MDLQAKMTKIGSESELRSITRNPLEGGRHRQMNEWCMVDLWVLESMGARTDI